MPVGHLNKDMQIRAVIYLININWSCQNEYGQRCKQTVRTVVWLEQQIKMAKSRDSGARLPEFETWFQHLQDVWLWQRRYLSFSAFVSSSVILEK